MLCEVCLGEGCDNCDHGKNFVDKFVNDMIGADGTDLFKQYRFLKEYGVFPKAGGLNDQDAIFIRCVEYCDLINFRLEKLKKAKSDEIKKMARTMNRKNAQ